MYKEKEFGDVNDLMKLRGSLGNIPHNKIRVY
jgi:hypothetical protein